MTTLIHTRDSAERLARAICSDISLYNQAALTADPSSKAVQEALLDGLSLYQTRTAPEHHPLFLSAAKRLIFGGLSPEQQGVLERALMTQVLQDALGVSPATPGASPVASGASLGVVWFGVGLVVLFALLWALLAE
jgi:AcrR family transcriptional regulator